MWEKWLWTCRLALLMEQNWIFTFVDEETLLIQAYEDADSTSVRSEMLFKLKH